MTVLKHTKKRLHCTCVEKKTKVEIHKMLKQALTERE